MTLASLIQEYGYAAVFAGTFIEGETVLIMAGFAAHRGYLVLPWVMATATLGSFLGDQLFFFLGRRYGTRLLQRFSILEARARRMRALLDRYHLPVILGVRFLYGLRTVGPMVIGMSHVPWPRFFLLNLLGAISWAIAVTSAGYLFGEALSLLMTNVRHYEAALLGVIALLGIAFWLMYRWRQRNTSR
jgi:membrane protein DedA with SNARE-associated domain